MNESFHVFLSHNSQDNADEIEPPWRHTRPTLKLSGVHRAVYPGVSAGAKMLVIEPSGMLAMIRCPNQAA